MKFTSRSQIVEFLEDFLKEGICWEEFEGCTAEELVSHIFDYCTYWF